jgi:hypothetical protein
MTLENDNKVIVGIRMMPEDVKALRAEAREKRTTMSGLIREKLFR